LEALELMGCAVYYSPFNAPLGIPYSAECSLLGAKARSYTDIAEAARVGAKGLSGLLGFRVELEGLAGWEYVGRMFNLYKYKMSLGGLGGEVRVVEASGWILGVYAAFGSPRAGQARRGLLGYPLIAWGRTERPVLLKSRWSEVIGQTFIEKPPLYSVEGPVESRGEWRLTVEGLVEKPLRQALEELASLGPLEVEGDLHCVTGWSVTRRMRATPSGAYSIRLSRGPGRGGL